MIDDGHLLNDAIKLLHYALQGMYIYAHTTKVPCAHQVLNYLDLHHIISLKGLFLQFSLSPMIRWPHVRISDALSLFILRITGSLILRRLRQPSGQTSMNRSVRKSTRKYEFSHQVVIGFNRYRISRALMRTVWKLSQEATLARISHMLIAHRTKFVATAAL